MTDDFNSAATKSDLAKLKAELIEAMFDGQVKVFKELYNFADRVQDRYRESDDLEANLKRRMATLELEFLRLKCASICRRPLPRKRFGVRPKDIAFPSGVNLVKTEAMLEALEAPLPQLQAKWSLLRT